MDYLISILLLTSGDSAPDVASLEKATLEYRRTVTSGHLILDSKIWSIIKGERQLKYVRLTEIWFDGNKIRGDVTRPSKPGSSFDGSNRKLVSSFSTDENIYWIDDGTTGSWVAQVSHRKDIPPTSDNYKVANPRLIGMVPSTAANLIHFDLESIVARPNRTGVEVRADVLNGFNCWRVTYRNANGGENTFWTSPKHGNTVIRIETQSESKSKTKLRELVESEVVKVPPSGIWFPKACLYQSYRNDELIKEERLEIKDVELNKPIDPKVFLIEGIGLRPGTLVSFGDAKTQRWDGQKLQSEPKNSPAVVPGQPLPPRGDWRYVVVGGLFALGAVFAAIQYAKQRKKGQTHSHKD